MEEKTLEERRAVLIKSLHSIGKIYEQYAKSFGLTPIGLAVLEAIYEIPEICTQKKICEYTHLPKQSVNVAIRSFLEKGYIEMKEIETDRRNKQIILSKIGQDYADKVVGKLLSLADKAINDLTDQQWQAIITLLNKVKVNLREGI